MAGSGGYDWKRDSDYWNRPQPELIPQSQEETDDKYQSTQVNKLLRDILKVINEHDYDAISRHREGIQEKLQEMYEDSEIIRYGGSHSRHTDISKVSDIDILTSLGDASNLPASSNAAIQQLARVLKQRFPRTEIDTGQMSVTLTFSDGIEVQVLPAYRYGQAGYKIPDPNGTGWITTHPKRFSRQLTAANENNSRQLIPVIKLAKAICNAKNVGLKSYHLENIALKAFERYSGNKTHPHMLRHFFSEAKRLVASTMPDPSGQSTDLSSYLSPNERKKVTMNLKSVEAEIVGAMKGNSLNRWENLFK